MTKKNDDIGRQLYPDRFRGKFIATMLSGGQQEQRDEFLQVENYAVEGLRHRIIRRKKHKESCKPKQL